MPDVPTAFLHVRLFPQARESQMKNFQLNLTQCGRENIRPLQILWKYEKGINK